MGKNGVERMTHTLTERQHYNKDREITCKRLGITENQYNWLRRKGQALHKVYEDNCNGLIADDDTYFDITSPIEKDVETYCKKLGLHVYFQTDPRGATIYVDVKPIPDNNYNQAECIY